MTVAVTLTSSTPLRKRKPSCPASRLCAQQRGYARHGEDHAATNEDESYVTVDPSAMVAKKRPQVRGKSLAAPIPCSWRAFDSRICSGPPPRDTTSGRQLSSDACGNPSWRPCDLQELDGNVPHSAWTRILPRHSKGPLTSAI